MELSELGSLKDFYLTNEVRPFTMRLSLALDIAEGMAFLHSARPKPIIHRDLKGANVLLALRAGRLLAKVTDFGLAVVKDSSTSKARANEIIAGTQLYIDPATYYEPIRRDAQCDIYAYAVVLTELASWEGPYGFPEDDFPWSWFQCSVIGADHRLRRPALDNMPDDVPVAFISLIQACWDPERKNRPLFAGGAISSLLQGMVTENSSSVSTSQGSEPGSSQSVSNSFLQIADCMEQVSIDIMLYLLYGMHVLTFFQADEAVGFLRSAVKFGHTSATIELGRLLLKGELVKRDIPEAVELLMMAAEDGEKDAVVLLAGYWLEEGCKYVAEKEFELAAALFRQSSDAGLIDAKVSLANLYDEGTGVLRDYAAAAKLFAEAAEAGNSAAMLKMGLYYETGCGVKGNFKTAAKFYTRAAKLGNVEAKRRLGECHRKGWGVQRDYGQAVKLFSEAAHAGDAVAKYLLGRCYQHGFGIGENKDVSADLCVEAAKLFKDLVASGSAEAQHYLGMCYEEGTGVPKNEKFAVELYRKAAALGNAYAKIELARRNIFGAGMPVDEREGARIYASLAHNGFAFAKHRLGDCYLKGLGVSEDRCTAARLYAEVTEAGVFIALCSLGQCYESGWGVPRDMRMAAKCYREAKAMGVAPDWVLQRVEVLGN
ncbi:Leucine-rich repeat serine/threonine-protein kinase 2 [Irineochytrium annulatum]|nr:Leucine-rich repeat serine/threonine-protein kinase 2 [Irineochytrium annulatum]